jgi:hypothetical protein
MVYGDLLRLENGWKMAGKRLAVFSSAVNH